VFIMSYFMYVVLCNFVFILFAVDIYTDIFVLTFILVMLF